MKSGVFFRDGISRRCFVLLAFLVFIFVYFSMSRVFLLQSGHGLDGSQLSLIRTVLIAGIPLSIALFPLIHNGFLSEHHTSASPFRNIRRSPTMNIMPDTVMLGHTAPNRAVSMTWSANSGLMALLIGAVLLCGSLYYGGFFVEIIPITAILQTAESGVAAQLLEIVINAANSPNNVMYFWITGLLPSFLDNAPTYFIFFNSAGGNPDLLQGSLANTLLAIYAGAVFMGATTYIGNASNIVAKSIVGRKGIRVPFLVRLYGLSSDIARPLFGFVTDVFFWRSPGVLFRV